MICRAKNCHNEAMPSNGLCGVHDEMAEDGTPFDLKRGPGRPPKPKLYPVAERRPYCVHPTKKGTERCQNYASVGSDMCGIHRRLVALGRVA